MPAEKTTTKASEARRSNKPLMEKRRRARINHSLTELKALILSAVKKDNSKHSKLEKADILEMTVKYLQNLQRQHVAVNSLTDSSVSNKFRAGFGECASEVSRFFERGEDNVETETRKRLFNHLTRCVDGLTHASAPLQSIRTPVEGTSTSMELPPSMEGVKLIPTRLTSGELAFILPTVTEPTEKAPGNAVLIKSQVWRPW